MPLSKLVALLGLDEVEAVRAVPLTDEALAEHRPNRQERRHGPAARRAVANARRGQ